MRIQNNLSLLLAGAAGLLLAGCSGENSKTANLATFDVQRGDLVIDVLEGGSIHALESLEIRSQVKLNDGTKILSIIEEGYEVTPQDVKESKVLVRLDPSPIEEEIVDHEVEFQQTEATYAESLQNLEIQESESQSEVKLVRQALRFALLDFQKFVGEKAAKEILRSLDLPYDNESLEAYEKEAVELIRLSFKNNGREALLTKAPPAPEAAKPPKGAVPAVDIAEVEDDTVDVSTESRASQVDFSLYLEDDRLGEGQAEQTMRRLQDEALVAQTELGVVAESVEGAKRLREKEFITKTTLENELINLEKARLTVQTAKTELGLFRDYEFPKEGEKMLSNYEEALLELVREHREAMAKMAQMEARYRTAKRRYELELAKRKDLQDQLESCVIKAEKAGLVAYGGKDRSYYGSSRYYEGISEGATLRLGQPIITIPDMSRLAVDVNIHESHVKRVQLGQPARITLDAFPDRTLTGRVSKLAVLPDSNASRYNPSLKVYPATIEIEGANEWLKPGMTAKVEIIVSELDNVVFIPVQAIFVKDDRHFCYLRKDGGGFERREVTVGEHNDDFIEIKKGIEEGEVVYLEAPDGYDRATEEAIDPSKLTSQRTKSSNKKA